MLVELAMTGGIAEELRTLFNCSQGQSLVEI